MTDQPKDQAVASPPRQIAKTSPSHRSTPAKMEKPAAKPARKRTTIKPQPKAQTVPVVPMRGMVAFPGMVLPLFIGRDKSIAAVESLEDAHGPRFVLLVSQRDEEQDEPETGDLHLAGTLAEVMQTLRMPDGNVRVVAQGRGRARVVRWEKSEPFFAAQIEPLLEEKVSDEAASRSLVKRLKSGFERAVGLSKTVPPEALQNALSLNSPGAIADAVAASLDVPVAERQRVLEMLAPLERATLVAKLLERELQVLELDRELDVQVKEGIDESQRDYFLRERLKAIQEKLGDRDTLWKEADTMRSRIADCALPDEAQERALAEIDRLEKMPPASPEASTIRTYIEWMCDLPWNNRTPDTLDVARAQEILDEDHHALEKIKTRIVEFLAVRKLNPHSRGPILCFAGPPGVGKTSLGQSIARSLGREFIRVSVGGIHDEAEIRGHRRTYIGSMPGRVLSALRRAKVKNPVFMLDEIDKLGRDHRGDPASALLEALDPEQNGAFSDHYLEVPFDLSEVMFVATANLLENIPPALRDRLEVLRFPGYTESEKKVIARSYLIPRQMKENGVETRHIEFPEDGVTQLIRDYTREAGVRNLQREIGTLCRKVARTVADDSWQEQVVMAPEALPGFLGPRRHAGNLAGEQDEVGVAQGLAYTEVGGELMPIEVTLVAGKGQTKLTGNLGPVMKESCEAAMTCARARAAEWGIEGDWTHAFDAHVHVPSGAVPKDGPSAGVAIAVALVSALTNRAVRRDVAMSGEISLRGRVWGVGGVKEKVLAAHRAGAKEVLLPLENERDLDELPLEIRESLQFHLVERLDDALKVALVEAA